MKVTELSNTPTDTVSRVSEVSKSQSFCSNGYRRWWGEKARGWAKGWGIKYWVKGSKETHNGGHRTLKHTNGHSIRGIRSKKEPILLW